ncbi:ABC transporter substrate-binding protein [Roseomonas sp. E05]|uniref:ABC transporter substrate-binding protein n=1 Tax=Roseomonas sp. E05 TaxID=3046310 RepID=UPI0024BB4DDB|nr:ABC transporter substrate-binding protein [Roseomonas sp. E05]MDJ0390019.1 ABC transporter substrate-binding protein [Roseomonas sp. E05]
MQTRREILGVAGATLFAASAARAQTASAGLKEAPALAARVQKGALPRVAERVGAEPLVVKPHERVGRYGGTIRSALRGGGDHNAILRLVGNQGLVRWSLTMSEVEPCVAKSWTASDDATTYTFILRRGMRWSDGAPFTADDILFSCNDLLFNRDFTPNPPARYVTAGQPMKVEKLDEVTVRFTFAAPNGRFLQELATPLGQHPVLYQKAYCAQFHPAYADPAKLQALLQLAGLSDWTALLRQRCGDIEIPARWQNPERPTLDPWTTVDPYTGGATRVTLQRNPYFWQVDSAGNQLPYVDGLSLPVISDIETILLRAMGGDLDLQLRHIILVQNRPVMEENKERGRYEIVDLLSTQANVCGLWFNQTVKDPRLRELFRNKDFRIAVSHALNRQEIIDSIYLGQAEPYQVGPVPQHPYYNEQLGTQYIAYDKAAAARLLDGIGLSRKDSQGFRLWPDGKRVFVTADVSVSSPDQVDAANLIKRDLAAVGLELGINTMERSLFYERAQRNDHEIGISSVSGGLDALQELRAIVAEHSLDSRQSLEWQRWFESGGKLGEEPTESMKRRFALLTRWRETGRREEQERLFRAMLQEAADAFEIVGIGRPLGVPGIRAAKLRNVPSPMIDSWSYPTPGATMLQQYFYTA